MNTILKKESHSQHDTIELGKQLGAMLREGDVILLVGDLGCGKTTITKGIVSALTDVDPDQVTSPTFTIIQDYEGEIPVKHVDLYRLDSPQEIFELDIETSAEKCVIVVEWGEKIQSWFQNPYIVEMVWVDENTRRIEIKKPD